MPNGMKREMEESAIRHVDTAYEGRIYEKKKSQTRPYWA